MIKLVKELVKNDMVDKDCVFEWGGGEPTILKEFNQTAKWLMSKGYFQSILTNALQISPIVISILEAGMGKVLISLDAGSSNTYKQVKGVDGWEKVKNVCATYSKHSVKNELITLNYIIYDKNNDISDISSFLDLCVEIGIKHVICTLEFKEMHARAVSQKTIESAAFFVYQAKERGIHCQPFSACEPYLSQINKLIACM